MKSIKEITEEYDKVYKAGEMTEGHILEYIKEIVEHSANLETWCVGLARQLKNTTIQMGVYRTLADFFSREDETYIKIFKEAEKATDEKEFGWGLIECESCNYEWPGCSAGRSERIECPKCKCMTPVPEETKE